MGGDSKAPSGKVVTFQLDRHATTRRRSARRPFAARLYGRLVFAWRMLVRHLWLLSRQHIAIWRIVRRVPCQRGGQRFGNLFEAFLLNRSSQVPHLLAIYHYRSTPRTPAPELSVSPQYKNEQECLNDTLRSFAVQFPQSVHLLVVTHALCYEDHEQATGLCNYDIYCWNTGLVGGLDGLRVHLVRRSTRFITPECPPQRLSRYRAMRDAVDQKHINAIRHSIANEYSLKRGTVHLKDLGFCNCYPDCNCYNTGICLCRYTKGCMCTYVLGSARFCRIRTMNIASVPQLCSHDARSRRSTRAIAAQ